MSDQTNKADGGKNNPALLFEDMGHALFVVNRVLDYGAEKYERAGWKTVEAYRYRAAKRRHSDAVELFCEEKDVESGLLHRAHEACNVLFLLQMEIEQKYASIAGDRPTAEGLAEFVKSLGVYNPPPTAHKEDLKGKPKRKKPVRLSISDEVACADFVIQHDVEYAVAAKKWNISTSKVGRLVNARIAELNAASKKRVENIGTCNA